MLFTNQFLNATVNLFSDRMKSELHLETENEVLSPALQQSCRGNMTIPTCQKQEF